MLNADFFFLHFKKIVKSINITPPLLHWFHKNSSVKWKHLEFFSWKAILRFFCISHEIIIFFGNSYQLMIKLRFFREIIYKIRKRINFTNFFISELNNTILLNIDFFPSHFKKNREINQQYAAASLISLNFFRQMKAFRFFFVKRDFVIILVKSHLMWNLM